MDKQLTEKLSEFFNTFKHQSYKKGEILIRADDDPQGVFYVQSGSIKEYAISRKGEEVIVNIFKNGAFFPMSWAMNDTPNVYYFEAVTDIDVCRVPKEDVLVFIRNNPDVLYDLLRRVYKGTDGLLMRMAYLMGGSAYERLVTELIIKAKRFGKRAIQGAISLSTSETDLAAATGMTRETVSREMKILKDKGIVALERNAIVIKDLRILENELM